MINIFGEYRRPVNFGMDAIVLQMEQNVIAIELVIPFHFTNDEKNTFHKFSVVRVHFLQLTYSFVPYVTVK